MIFVQSSTANKLNACNILLIKERVNSSDEASASFNSSHAVFSLSSVRAEGGSSGEQLVSEEFSGELHTAREEVQH